MSALNASAVVFLGGGTRFTMDSKVSSIPIPTLADTWEWGARSGRWKGGKGKGWERGRGVGMRFTMDSKVSSIPMPALAATLQGEARKGRA